MSVLEKLAAEGRLTVDQQVDIRQTVSEFLKLAEQFPELNEEALEKVASPFSGKVLDTAKSLGTIALFAGAANMVGDVYETAKDAISKSRNYKAMMDQNPDLKDLDSTTVQRAFTTLHKFNPQYASDPSVAGEFVTQRARQQGLDFNQLKNIVDAGKSTRPSRQSVMQHITDPSTVAKHVMSPMDWSGQDPVQEENLRKAQFDTSAAEQRAQRAAEINRGFGIE